MKRLLKRALAGGLSRTMLAAVAGAGLAAASLPAQAVEYPVNFGEPVVLSEGNWVTVCALGTWLGLHEIIEREHNDPWALEESVSRAR